MQIRVAPDWPNQTNWLKILLLTSIAIGCWTIPFVRIVPHDYVEFLLPWLQHIQTEGPADAFRHPFSNYTPPYLYLLAAVTFVDLPPLIRIKFLSMLGSIWAAYGAYRTLREYRAERRFEACIFALLLPTVIINAPVLGQADMFWVAPCLLAIAASVRKQLLPMVTWFGVGLAFKAQAVFLGPFVAAALIAARSRWWYWFIPAMVYAAAMLPAWFAGWPVGDLLTIYLRQAEYLPPNGIRYVSTASNWWAFFAYADYALALRTFWLGYVLAAAGTAVYIWRFASRPADTLIAAAVSSTMLPFLLPGMHERFYALAELSVFCWAWTRQSTSGAVAALLMQAQLVLAFFAWIYDRAELRLVGALLVIVVLGLMASELLVPPRRSGGCLTSITPISSA